MLSDNFPQAENSRGNAEDTEAKPADQQDEKVEVEMKEKYIIPKGLKLNFTFLVSTQTLAKV